MPAPDKNIPEFARGNKLQAMPLEQMRQTLVTLVRAFEAQFGPLDGRPAATAYPVKITSAVANRSGISNGNSYRPPIVPTASGALAAENLGGTLTTEDSSNAEDVEVWNLATLRLRLGHIAGHCSDGRPIFLVDDRGYFPVLVTKDGGSNGTKTTAASWTYTVKDLESNTLAQNVALARPRPYGTATQGSTYGEAFYDGSTLKLWDAGEIYGTGGC